MRYKSSSLPKTVSILVFLFFINNLFPNPSKTALIKIYKHKDADYEILHSPQIRVVQELKTCFIAYVDSGFSSNLNHAGLKLNYLDDDIKDKKYYLVYLHSPSEFNALDDYGNVRSIEEKSAIFWSDKENIREILPARFKLIPLPRKPLRHFKQRFLVQVESAQPEIKLHSEPQANNPLILSTETELIKIFKNKDADFEILYSPWIKIVQELKTCFIAHINSGYSSKLSIAGFNLENLDDDIKDKKYFLVYCPSPFDISTLNNYGNAKIIEENLALFWSDKENAREVLPAHFELTSLPDEPLHSFKKRRLAWPESFHPEIQPSQEFEINPVILEIVSQVSEDNIRGHIQTLQDYQTRYASTFECELAGDFIYDFFIQQGLTAEFDSFLFESNYSSNNIIATLEGKVDSTQIVIICAHYDSFSNLPNTLAPGADDNASGCAAVMEASRILAPYSFDFSVKFICFSAEEWGLYGSRDFAREATQRGEDIIAVINLDMIAYTDFLPEDLDIISNTASRWLADRFSLTSNMYTLLDISKIVDPSIIWSDHSPFWERGYSAILGIEDFPISNPYFHTINDTIDTLNLNFMTEVVKASLAAAADLAQPVGTPRTPTGLNSRSQIISSLFSSTKTAYLNWDNNQDQVVGYNIYRTTTSRMNYQKLNSSPLLQTYYVDKNLDSDTRYYYVITAVDIQNNESNYSKEVAEDEGNEYIN